MLERRCDHVAAAKGRQALGTLRQTRDELASNRVGDFDLIDLVGDPDAQTLLQRLQVEKSLERREVVTQTLALGRLPQVLFEHIALGTPGGGTLVRHRQLPCCGLYPQNRAEGRVGRGHQGGHQGRIRRCITTYLSDYLIDERADGWRARTPLDLAQVPPQPLDEVGPCAGQRVTRPGFHRSPSGRAIRPPARVSNSPLASSRSVRRIRLCGGSVAKPSGPKRCTVNCTTPEME